MRRASPNLSMRSGAKSEHRDLQPDAMGVATRLAAVRLREAGVACVSRRPGRLRHAWPTSSRAPWLPRGDLGQTGNPSPADGLQLSVTDLMKAGLSKDQITTMGPEMTGKLLIA